MRSYSNPDHSLASFVQDPAIIQDLRAPFLTVKGSIVDALARASHPFGRPTATALHRAGQDEIFMAFGVGPPRVAGLAGLNDTAIGSVDRTGIDGQSQREYVELDTVKRINMDTRPDLAEW